MIKINEITNNKIMKKFSLLLVFALVLMGSFISAPKAEAIVTAVSITSPTTGSPAYVQSGTSLTVNFDVTATSTDAGDTLIKICNTAETTCIQDQAARAVGEFINGTASLSQSIIVSGLSEGTYKLIVYARQPSSGTWISDTETGAVVVDNTAPTIAVTDIVGITISEAGDTIAITFTDANTVSAADAAWSADEFTSISGSTSGALTLTTAGFNFVGSTLTITLDEATDSASLWNGEFITVTPALNAIQDAAGNFVANTPVVGTVAVTGDVTGPTVALTYVPDQTVYKDADAVTITATFNEDVDEGTIPTIAIETAGDGGVLATGMAKTTAKIWTYAWTVPAGADDDGTATSTIVATDLAGNANAAATNNTKLIDNTAPTLTTDIVGRTIQDDSDTITLTFSDTNAVSAADGDWTDCDEVAIQSPNGTDKTLVGASCDYDVGTKTLTITLDEDATDAETYLVNGNSVLITPALNAIQDAAGNFVANSEVTSALDVDGDIDLPTLSSITYTQGSTVVTVIRPSAYGLIVEVTTTFNEAMTTAPTVWIQAPGTDADLATTTMSSTSATEWYYDNWRVPNIDAVQGEAVITFVGTDLAGNSFDSAATQSVVIDEKGPVIANEGITLDLPQYRLTQDPTVTVTVVEDNTASTVTVNGASATESTSTPGTWTGSFAHGKSSAATYSFDVVATDAYSNVTTQPVQYRVVADDAPDAPVIAIITPAAGDTILETYNVTFTTNDATTTDAYISIDGAAWVAATTNDNPGTYSLDTTALANGSHTLRVKDTVNTVTGYSDYITFIVINSEAEAPTVVAQSPEGDVEEDWDGPIYIDFSEWMKPSTLNDTTIKICQGSSSTPSETCLDDLVILPTASSTGQTRAIISNDISLDYDATYWIVVSTGTTDMADNPLNQADQDHEGAYWGSFTMGPAPEGPEVDLSIDNITLTNIGETNGEWNDDGSAGDAYEWVIRVTLPADEPPLLAFQFDDWTNGLDTADNMRYWSEEIEVGEVGSAGDPMSITVANSYVDGDIEITGDSDTWESGIQTNIHVQLQIPGDTPAGSHSTSFKVRSGGAI